MNLVMSCVASHDYVVRYTKCIDSQQKYCEKYGYDYVLNCDSSNIINREDWYWKKLWVIPELLEQYDVAVIIDADCEIKNTAPALESVIDNNSIYYVLGISKRPNSGFLIFKNTPRSNQFIGQALERRGQPLPQDCVVKGENGYVIWLLKEDASHAKQLPLMWNCSDPEHANDAYIIHYTNKMREFFTAT
jgi:hypothetical protein